MTRASNNGNLDDAMRAVVVEMLAQGGLHAVVQRFSKVGGGEHVGSALAYANGYLLDGFYSDDELADVPLDERADHAYRVDTERRRLAAVREARALDAADRVIVPEFPQGTLADDLAHPQLDVKYCVDDLLPANSNGVVYAEKKAGKTTFMANLMKALADEEPFLGVYLTHLVGRVAYFNYEVHAAMFRDWLRDIGISNNDRVAAPFHLRGRSLPFWTQPVKERTVAWLQENDIGFWIVDPGARAWRPLVNDENSNSQMAEFTDAVDEVKYDAGVREVLLVHHLGSMAHAEDRERGRGATRLGDWLDAGWYLTKDKTGRRWFRADGRDVDQEAVALDYDEATRTVSFTGLTRTAQRHESHLLDVLQTLADMESSDERATVRALRTAVPGDNSATGSYIKHAVDGGYVKVTSGDKNAKLHELTKKGRKYLAAHGGDAS